MAKRDLITINNNIQSFTINRIFRDKNCISQILKENRKQISLITLNSLRKTQKIDLRIALIMIISRHYKIRLRKVISTKKDSKLINYFSRGRLEMKIVNIMKSGEKEKIKKVEIFHFA